MTIVAQFVARSDDTPAVLLLKADGTIEYAVTPIQLWQAVKASEHSSWTFRNVHKAGQEGDWVTSRRNAKDEAIAEAESEVLRKIDEYIAKHGVNRIPKRHFVQPPKVKPSKPLKTSTLDPTVLASLENLF